MENKVAWSIFI